MTDPSASWMSLSHSIRLSIFTIGVYTPAKKINVSKKSAGLF